jgi:flagellar motor switch protein FliN/FliY
MVHATEELPRNLDFLLDVYLEVSVQVGQTRMTIQDLLQLGQGSVIELTKLAGEPLDVYINDRLVARGEAVIVNEKFGVRITDIVSQHERIEGLG